MRESSRSTSQRSKLENKFACFSTIRCLMISGPEGPMRPISFLARIPKSPTHSIRSQAYPSNPCRKAKALATPKAGGSVLDRLQVKLVIRQVQITSLHWCCASAKRRVLCFHWWTSAPSSLLCTLTLSASFSLQMKADFQEKQVKRTHQHPPPPFFMDQPGGGDFGSDLSDGAVSTHFGMWSSPCDKSLSTSTSSSGGGSLQASSM